MAEGTFDVLGDATAPVDGGDVPVGDGEGPGAEVPVGDRWPEYVPDKWFVRRGDALVRTRGGDRVLAEFARTKIMHIKNCKGMCKPGMHDPVAQALIDEGYVYRRARHG
jgi:hypothetical protein